MWTAPRGIFLGSSSAHLYLLPQQHRRTMTSIPTPCRKSSHLQPSQIIQRFFFYSLPFNFSPPALNVNQRWSPIDKTTLRITNHGQGSTRGAPMGLVTWCANLFPFATGVGEMNRVEIGFRRTDDSGESSFLKLTWHNGMCVQITEMEFSDLGCEHARGPATRLAMLSGLFSGLPASTWNSFLVCLLLLGQGTTK